MARISLAKRPPLVHRPSCPRSRPGNSPPRRAVPGLGCIARKHEVLIIGRGLFVPRKIGSSVLAELCGESAVVKLNKKSSLRDAVGSPFVVFVRVGQNVDNHAARDSPRLLQFLDLQLQLGRIFQLPEIEHRSLLVGSGQCRDVIVLLRAQDGSEGSRFSQVADFNGKRV